MRESTTHIQIHLSAFAIIYVVRCASGNHKKMRKEAVGIVPTSVLVHNALLNSIEAVASLIGPPLLELAVLVVETASGIKGMLEPLLVRKLPREAEATYSELMRSDHTKAAVSKVVWPFL